MKRATASPLFFCLVASGLLGQSPVRLAPEKLQAVKVREYQRIALAESHLRGARSALGLDARHGFTAHGRLTDEMGQTHARFRQAFHGVPVWGGDYIAHLDAENTLLEATDALARRVELDVTPTLASEQVLAIVHDRLAPKGPYAFAPKSELVVYPHEDDRAPGHSLAYHVHTELDNYADGMRSTDFLVDAHSGEILSSWNSLETATPVEGTGRSQYSGTVKITTNALASGYEMRDTSRPAATGNQIRNLDHADGWIGPIYTDTDNTWGDGANYIHGGSTTNANGQTVAVDAMYGLQSSWDYFQKVHGRNGIDNTGKFTFIGVHRGTLYDNAAWSSTYFGMILGDGSGTANGGMNTVASLDVLAHEFSHGVCANSAKLVYQRESGGLNEANSDINGTMVEFNARRGGGAVIGDQLASNLTAIDGGNWTIGEQLGADPAKPLRYMYKPSLDRISPDFWYPEIGDMDVHYSGGPMNRCFYFMSAGATTSGATSTATNTPAYGLTEVDFLPGGMMGIGNDRAAKVWYRALTSYLTSTSGYFAARKACQRAATDLYGANSSELAAVNNAFAAINVGNPAGLPDDTLVPTIQSVTTVGGPAGLITLRAAATDNVGITRVLFYVDGNMVGKATSAGSAWELSFDSTGVANGTHSLVAKAYDDYDNLATSTTTYFATQNATYRPLINASFENGLTSWNQVNTSLASKAANIHSGLKAAWFGGFGSAGTGSIYQSVDLPATATSITAGFWMKIVTKDRTSANSDLLKATIKDAAGTKVLGYLGNATGVFSNQDIQDPAVYVYYAGDITALKGQKVRICFDWSEDATSATAWYLDDVHLQVSTGTTPSVNVSVSPTSASLKPGAMQQFVAAVTGSSNTAVTWKASGGTVTNGGLYTAPATAGSYTVTATSVADPGESATANVKVSVDPIITVTIAPPTVTLPKGGTQQFTASVMGSSSTGVTWSCTGGLISSTGLYTAPNAVGTYTVKAVSVADTTKSDQAIVTVIENVTSEKLLNGGFESGATSWSGTSGAIGNWNVSPYFQKSFAGLNAAYLGGNGKTTTESLYQTATIPTSATKATLSFYLHIDSAETTSYSAYDKLAVSLQNASGTVLKTLATYSNLNKAAGYQLRSFDVSAFKGQTIRVYFKATEDSMYQTSFLLDNVSLQVQ